MKRIFIGAILAIASTQAITLEQSGEILDGILVGALNETGFSDITQCFTDLETFGEDIFNAVGQFEEWNIGGVE